MTVDEFHRLYWQQTFDEGWMLSQFPDGTYGICASGRTLATSPVGTIQDMIGLDRSWVAAVVLRAIYEGHPCHVEAARIHYAGLNPILMDIPFIQMENGSTITFNRDHPLPESSWKEPECSTCGGHGVVFTGHRTTDLCPAVGCSFRDKAAETGMAASTGDGAC